MCAFLAASQSTISWHINENDNAMNRKRITIGVARSLQELLSIPPFGILLQFTLCSSRLHLVNFCFDLLVTISKYQKRLSCRKVWNAFCQSKFYGKNQSHSILGNIFFWPYYISLYFCFNFSLETWKFTDVVALPYLIYCSQRLDLD